jgi:hypothetical protein
MQRVGAVCARLRGCAGGGLVQQRHRRVDRARRRRRGAAAAAAAASGEAQPEPVGADAAAQVAHHVRQVRRERVRAVRGAHHRHEPAPGAQLEHALARQARERLLKLMGLSEATHAVFFLGGGASLHFAQVPMNFLSPGQSADFLPTGEWPGRAIEEARFFGTARVAGSSAETRFDRIPRSLQFDPGARYVHLCTNNTIKFTLTSYADSTGILDTINIQAFNGLMEVFAYNLL